MNRIQAQAEDQSKLARRVLSWILFSRRRLTTVELQHALAVEIQEVDLDPENLSDVEELVSVCCGLVTVDHESGFIRLVHYTAQDYLEKTHRSYFPGADAEILKICIAYLSFDHFGSGCCSTIAGYERRQNEYPLYEYAARNWAFHALLALLPTSPGLSIEEDVITFLKKQAHVESSSQMLPIGGRWVSLHHEKCRHIPYGVTGLHLVAYFDLVTAMPATSREFDVNVVDIYHRTPLMFAADRGATTAARMLIYNGAHVNHQDADMMTPLSLAAIDGHEDMIRLLIDAGAELEVRAKPADTHSTLTALGERLASVDLLADRGAEVATDYADVDSVPLVCQSCPDNLPGNASVHEEGKTREPGSRGHSTLR